MSRSDIPILLARARYALEVKEEDDQSALELLLCQIEQALLPMDKKERVDLVEAIEQCAMDQECEEDPQLMFGQSG